MSVGPLTAQEADDLIAAHQSIVDRLRVSQTFIGQSNEEVNMTAALLLISELLNRQMSATP